MDVERISRAGFHKGGIGRLGFSKESGSLNLCESASDVRARCMGMGL